MELISQQGRGTILTVLKGNNRFVSCPLPACLTLEQIRLTLNLCKITTKMLISTVLFIGQCPHSWKIC